MLPMPFSKIKKNFCCRRSLCAGLFKILNFFPHSIQCWKIFPGIWDGDECLYFSIVFCSIIVFITHYTVYTVLCIFTLETKAFSYFSPLLFLCLVCNEQTLSLRAPEGSVVLKASAPLALPGYFLGTRRLNVIYWMLFTDLLEWLKS